MIRQVTSNKSCHNKEQVIRDNIQEQVSSSSMVNDNTSIVKLYIMKIQVDPMKRGKPNGDEDTRLNTKKYCEIPDLQNPGNQRVNAFQ